MSAPALADKVAFLASPEAWDEPVASVEVIQTHWAFVFLTPTRVHKLKKPQQVDILDNRSLADRERNCREEVRLNRRLAPDVYLGVVPLTWDGVRLAVDGSGEVVDWLVRMVRLPAAEMLDVRITTGAPIDLDRVDTVAASFARFHLAQRVVQRDPAAYLAWLRARVEENRTELCRAEFALDAARIGRICDAQRDHLVRSAALFEARVRAGRIVDGHGDLRPEHVCLDPPRILDCLEFDAGLRALDAVHELAFFALECRRLGGASIGDRFLRVWTEVSGDTPPPAVVALYTSHRALIRARLAAWRLGEDLSPERAEAARRKCDWYVAAAQAALDGLRASPTAR